MSFGVLFFDFGKGVVDEFADGSDFVGGLFAVDDLDFSAGGKRSVFLNGFPAGEGWNPEHILFDVVVADFEFGPDFFRVGFIAVVVGRIEVVVAVLVAELGFNFVLANFEGVRDVLQKDQAENSVLVDGGVKVGAELVRGGPEFFVEVAKKLLLVGHPSPELRGGS